MKIRLKVNGVLAEVDDEHAERLIAQGDWVPAQAPKKRTTQRGARRGNSNRR